MSVFQAQQTQLALGTPLPIVKPENSQFSCLVLAHQDEHHKLISTWLGISKRISSVTTVSETENLNKHLRYSQHQLCIIVIDQLEQTLPVCLAAHPDMRVLVLTATRKLGKRTAWYQQGANDVVSLRKSAAARHAISRMIDDCVAHTELQFLAKLTEKLDKEIVSLKATLENEQRSTRAAGNETTTIDASASNDDRYSAIKQLEIRLQTLKQPIVENIISNYNSRDQSTGISERPSVLERFQTMLQSDIPAPRFTAMLVSILNEDSGDTTENNVQDLTLYRAADTLQKCLAKGTILGRVNQNGLLLIQSSDIEPVPRDAANRVRDALGSLGGLIDSATHVHINTMNLPSKTRFSADQVVERLEALG